MSDSGNQKDLLSQWLNRKEDNDNNQSSSAKSGPLTPGQERLFILQELHDGNPFYHYTEVYSFSGNFDLNTLIKSFEDVVSKHDILRTTFSWENGQARQSVQEKLAPELIIIDPAPKDPDARKALQKKEARRPLDIQNNSPVRLSVFKINDEQADFVITMHHIVTDKWSMRQFRDDWAYFYKTKKGENPTEPKSGMRYLDYALEKSNKPNTDHSLTFWKNHLNGIPIQMPLETDYSRPKRLAYSGKFVTRSISPETSQRALNLAQSLGVTPYAFFLSIFKYWLSRQTQTTDIIIGTPISNRNKEELENSIGFFNETVIIRSHIQAEQTIQRTITEIHESCLLSFSHSDVPFEELVKALQPTRQENLNPLFQVMFLYHDVPDQPIFHPDIQLKYEPFDLGVAKFDLTLYISNDHGELTSIVEYNDELFSKERMDVFLESYLHLLDQVVVSPELTWNHLSHIAHRELDLIQSWSQGPRVSNEEKTILHWLSNTEDSNLPAVWYDNEEWKYSELLEDATALSQSLIHKGLRPGQGVGLVSHPGYEMVVGITGILMAGGFYIPLDPTYPEERLQYMLNDSDARFLVCSEGAHIESGINPGIETIHISNLPDYVGTTLPEVTRDLPAYMIYTSGSTGNPKGVLVKHHHLYNSTAARSEFYGADSPRYLLLSSFSFDSSVAGIFWSIYSGGCLILTPRRIEQDPQKLGEIIECSQATHTLMLPSLYQVLLELIPKSKMQSLRKIIVAGEHCNSALIDKHHELLPQAKLYNEYGPTEATVWSSVGELQQNQITHIGGPILNTNTWIVDREDQLAPMGVPGELIIGGNNVTDGYYKRPDLTASKFVQLEKIDATRLYRTGDLVKWNRSGQLIFLGRKDEQIKLRGYRIELGEISSSIANTHGIDKAVTIVHNSSTLVSYYTGLEYSESEIKSSLSSILPNYMVPEYVIHVSEFPLLPNGKIDKVVLVEDYPISRSSKTTVTSPENEKQSILHEIWTRVLDRTEIDIQDNFFSIGGDSIKSIQVVAQLREKGFKLRPEDIFTFQNIEALSHQLQSLEAANISTSSVSGQAPWLPIHHWFFALHRNQPQHWGQAYTVMLSKNYSLENVQTLFDHLLRSYPGLRSNFDLENKLIKIESYKSHPVDRIQLDDSKSYLENWMIKSNVEKDTLFRCAFDPTQNTILLSGHHLVLDAISWNIIFLSIESFLQEKSSSISSHSILDWSNHLSTSYGQIDSTENWEPPQVSLEADIHTHVISIPYDSDLFENENALSLTKEEYCLALASIIQNQLKSSDTLNVAIESNGRNSQGTDIDLSRAVGWFTCMYEASFPSLDISSSPKDYLTNLKETFRDSKKYMFQKANDMVKSFVHSPDHFLFNYLGSKEGMNFGDFDIEFVVDGVRSMSSERNYKTEFNVWDTGQTLDFHCSLISIDDLEERIKKAETKALTASIELSKWLTGEEQKYTPGDFTDVDIDQDDLDALLGEFE